MRIDAIAECFGAEVRRAEVGEANVVNLARNLRAEGKIVRILGEGSNGGNITHPATCRDPLNTLMSIIKLMLMRGEKSIPGLFRIWCDATGSSAGYNGDFSLTDVIDSLPKYTTSSAYEDRAIMRIECGDHGKLKVTYEEIFQRQWELNREYLRSAIGADSWEAVNYEGTEAKSGIGNRDTNGPQRGGLKIVFQDQYKNPIAYIWMRGSGTEPVFRILADVRGVKPKVEDYLLQWQRRMLVEADNMVLG